MKMNLSPLNESVSAKFSSLATCCALLFVMLGASGALAGTKDGGGGGAANGKPATINEIVHGAHIAKFPLRMWLNASEYKFRLAYAKDPQKAKKDNPELIKLFLESRTIFDVIDELQIVLRMNAPCYDKNGRAVDGSIHGEAASGPNAVCISALRLAKKLTADDYEFKTAGLILHEASHLLGATEAEAVKLQVSAQERITKFDLNDAWKKTTGFQNAASTLNRDISNFGELRFDGLFKLTLTLSDLVTNMGDFFRNPGEQLLAAYRAKERDLIVSLYMKTWNLMIFACENDPQNSGQSQGKCNWDYDKTFGPKSPLPTSELAERLSSMFDGSPELDPLIRKVSTLDDVRGEITDVQNDVVSVWTLLDKSYGIDHFGFPLIEK